MRSVTLGLLILATLPALASAAPKGEAAFRAECAACHIAFPANFLPKRSWSAIMADLPNHFGEDASLDAATKTEIEDYLQQNAADARGTPRWLKSLPATEAPLRISEFPWFQHEHGSRLIARAEADPAIGSISNCVACHKGAERGHFDDD
jgi:hypothetical protein